MSMIVYLSHILSHETPPSGLLMSLSRAFRAKMLLIYLLEGWTCSKRHNIGLAQLHQPWRGDKEVLGFAVNNCSECSMCTEWCERGKSAFTRRVVGKEVVNVVFWLGEHRGAPENRDQSICTKQSWIASIRGGQICGTCALRLYKSERR